MDIGIPLENEIAENRVALSPAGVHRLVQHGHRVYVQQTAGAASRYADEEYLRAGGELVYGSEEVFGRGDLILKVRTPEQSECAMLREEQVLMCFLRPAVAPETMIRSMLERGVASVALELIEDREGNAPVLRAISEIAGPMSVQIAAHLLESGEGGRGILLGGAPGVPPASVVVLGAGVVGSTAAFTAVSNGAQVIVLDSDVARLRRVEEHEPAVTTMLAEDYHLSRAVAFADVVIGAVNVRGGPTPSLISDRMVREMKAGAVIIDVSIDQGGCLERSRPTTSPEPTYVRHGVVHYAVPNMTSNVARTATYALNNACLPYVLSIAEAGLAAACAADAGLLRGVVTCRGRCLQPQTAARLGVPLQDVGVLAHDEGLR